MRQHLRRGGLLVVAFDLLAGIQQHRLQLGLAGELLLELRVKTRGLVNRFAWTGQGQSSRTPRIPRGVADCPARGLVAIGSSSSLNAFSGSQFSLPPRSTVEHLVYVVAYLVGDDRDVKRFLGPDNLGLRFVRSRAPARGTGRHELASRAPLKDRQ